MEEKADITRPKKGFTETKIVSISMILKHMKRGFIARNLMIIRRKQSVSSVTIVPSSLLRRSH